MRISVDECSSLLVFAADASARAGVYQPKREQGTRDLDCEQGRTASTTACQPAAGAPTANGGALASARSKIDRPRAAALLSRATTARSSFTGSSSPPSPPRVTPRTSPTWLTASFVVMPGFKRLPQIAPSNRSFSSARSEIHRGAAHRSWQKIGSAWLVSRRQLLNHQEKITTGGRRLTGDEGTRTIYIDYHHFCVPSKE